MDSDRWFIDLERLWRALCPVYLTLENEVLRLASPLLASLHVSAALARSSGS